MITVSRASARNGPELRQEVWLCAYPATAGASGNGASLETLKECRLPPGAAIPRYRHQAAEIITYLREGALAYEDSTGRSGVIQAGEFQRTTAGRSLRHRETNASRNHWAHLFQVRLPPPVSETRNGYEVQRFSAAQRRGLLTIIASPDGRGDSLHLQQDVVIHSALLDPGQHVASPLAAGRRAWLHIVIGEVSLGDVTLTTGDGAGLEEELAVSLTARQQCEVLLLDMPAA